VKLLYETRFTRAEVHEPNFRESTVAGALPAKAIDLLLSECRVNPQAQQLDLLVYDNGAVFVSSPFNPEAV
jgi:hypothetical protein